MMRLSKFFSFAAIFAMVATYIKADEAPEVEFETSPSLQQEEIGFNEEPVSYHSTADERTDTDTETLPPYDQGYSIEEDQMMSAYNSPARIDVTNCWDIFVKGTYIWWLPKLKGMEYAIGRPADFSTAAAVDYTYKLHNVSQSDYKSGFKVALGTNLCHDNWTMLINYARLYASNKSSTSLSTYSYQTYPERLISLWMDSHLEHITPGTNQGPFTKLTGKLKTKYNVLNLEFARPFYEGTCLTLRPFVGLTGGWIKFNFKSVGTILTNTFTLHSKSHSTSWLIGPRTGLDGNWFLGSGFNMQADVAGALAYQNIKVDYKQNSDYYPDHYFRLANGKEYTQITPVLEGKVGLGWGTYFADNGWHFSLKALYEFLYYFEQNHMRKVAAQLINSTSLEGARAASGAVNGRANGDVEDFFLHGLTITARLDF